MDATSYDLLCAKMQADWDRRARENYRHYIVNSREDWSAADFVASGQETCARYIATDMTNVCQGKDPAEMRVLDFGCGAGESRRARPHVRRGLWRGYQRGNDRPCSQRPA